MQAQRTLVRTGMLLLALFASVACGPATAVVAVPDCAPAALSVTTGASNGAAGTVYTTLVLRNRSSKACRLSGTPAAQPVLRTGTTVTSAGPLAKPIAFPSRGGSVVIRPGARASVILGVTEAGNYPKASCRPTDANAVVVTFRHLASRTRVTFVLPPTRVCSKLASTRISGIALGTKSP